MTVPYLKKKVKLPELPEVIEPHWRNIVLELLTRGVPKVALANRCEICRETLDGIINGRTEPKWYSGQKLLQIHKAVVMKNIASERIQHG